MLWSVCDPYLRPLSLSRQFHLQPSTKARVARPRSTVVVRVQGSVTWTTTCPFVPLAYLLLTSLRSVLHCITLRYLSTVGHLATLFHLSTSPPLHLSTSPRSPTLHLSTSPRSSTSPPLHLSTSPPLHLATLHLATSPRSPPLHLSTSPTLHLSAGRIVLRRHVVLYAGAPWSRPPSHTPPCHRGKRLLFPR